LNAQDLFVDGLIERLHRSTVAPSNPHIVLRRTAAALFAGIEDPARLDQQQLDLVFGIRLVFDSLGDDEHFAAATLSAVVPI